MSRTSRGAAGRTAGVLLDALFATTRFQVTGAEHYRRHVAAGQPVIFVLWHGRLLPLSHLHRKQGVAPIISASRDGDYIASVVEHWGFHPVRGSSSRGGSAALRELVRLVRAGHSLAITPDGPRGPREQVKPGVVTTARLTGAPLVPVTAGTTRAWWFEGWDRFLVPKPLARIRVAYAPGTVVPRDADDAEAERIRASLEAELHRLTRMVDGEPVRAAGAAAAERAHG